MKYIYIIILILTTLSCKAQITIYEIGTPPEQRTVTDNYYYKDINNYNDAFAGVWRWEDGNSSFELTLQEFEQYDTPLPSNIYVDRLFGKYTYIENGQVIADILTIDVFPDLKVSVVYRTPNEYAVVLKDVVSETNKVGEFKIITPNTATLRLWNSEGVKINYGNGQPWALPTSLTLTKIN